MQSSRQGLAPVHNGGVSGQWFKSCCVSKLGKVQLSGVQCLIPDHGRARDLQKCRSKLNKVCLDPTFVPPKNVRQCAYVLNLRQNTTTDRKFIYFGFKRRKRKFFLLSCLLFFLIRSNVLDNWSNMRFGF